MSMRMFDIKNIYHLQIIKDTSLERYSSKIEILNSFFFVKYI